MVVWGGYGTALFGPAFLNTGGRYDPVTDNWMPTTQKQCAFRARTPQRI
jgi:hypothetical protein